MKEIINKIDKMAQDLEDKGLLKEAHDLDMVSNTLEAADEGETVGVNDFAKRHLDPGFSGTKLSQAQMEKFRKEAEKQAKAGQLKKGNAPWVRIAVVKDPTILSPIVKVTPENEKFLQTEKTKRRDFEDEYEHRFFDKKDVKGTPSHHIDLILYTKDQLASEVDGNPSGADYDIISVNAEFGPDSVPMAPSTLKRNAEGKDKGGSGRQYTPEEMEKSEAFWKDHALVK